MYSIFDPIFIADSYSCRLGKGTHIAINRLQKFARKVSKNNARNCYVLKCDIKKFFDSIDHDILISLIEKKICDKDALQLIEKIIKGYSTFPSKGLPLGNITSQIFANIYLNELDQFIKHKLKIKYYIRYCDDFVILSGDDVYLKNLIFMIGEFLNQKLGLFLHPNKIEIKKYHQGIDFLGYISFPHHVILRIKTKRRIFMKIKQKMQKLKQNKISEESFEQCVQSYFGMLGHCNAYKLQKIIEEEIQILGEF